MRPLHLLCLQLPSASEDFLVCTTGTLKPVYGWEIVTSHPALFSCLTNTRCPSLAGAVSHEERQTIQLEDFTASLRLPTTFHFPPHWHKVSGLAPPLSNFPVHAQRRPVEVRGRYHGGRRPPRDDSLHSPTVIPPSALDKPSIMKCYHRRRTTR